MAKLKLNSQKVVMEFAGEFPGWRWGWEDSWFLHPLFCPWRQEFAVPQSWGTSANHHDQSKTIGSLASARSLSTCRYFPPKQWIYRYPVYLSIPWPDPCQGWVSAPDWPMISWTWDSWRIFPCPVLCQVPFSSGATFFPGLPVVTSKLREDFPVVFDIPGQISDSASAGLWVS